ncbi:hypothetical protein A6P39_000115 [Streptomyces sp. FXJ1.172]|uniref:hypothetical protein n=1 Tax=Streptomyces sp. FXJ1.172 TaxID=710705 RepID=UPI000A5D8379|nr:hypothetical protein [Streptomyces sp. FXJ1.172]WEO92663.1 hypothetical protein A6P39_000115 [Streptomyces sp. FXJ1.172]
MSIQRLERLTPGGTDTSDLVVYEGEVVEDDDNAAALVRYLITQHTMLGPGQLPPLADARPAWTDADFRLTAEDVAEFAEPDLAENTIVNRDSTVRAFEAWCAEQNPPRLARPCTTATYTSYGLRQQEGRVQAGQRRAVHVPHLQLAAGGSASGPQPLQGPPARLEEGVCEVRGRGRPGGRRHHRVQPAHHRGDR